jgi:hypothetical protein
MTGVSGSRLETNTSFINDLISDIRSGEVKIPQFQRKFVWKEQQALDLLDSILRNYPVGSLLLWRTQTKLTTERNIGDFKLPATEEMSPTNYVLDGQQRLTVIYSCLGAGENEDGFKAGYNLVKEEFVQLSDIYEQYTFPLRIVFNTTKLLNFRAGLISHPSANKLQERLDNLLHAFTTYKFPVVTLKEQSIQEVGTIFERINSSGTKLSTYDLIVAATWTQNFSLDDKVQDITSSLSSKKFNDIEPNTILKCLAAVENDGIRKSDIFNLRNLDENKINATVDKTKASILRTVDAFATEFGIFSNDFLPYEAQFIILNYIYNKNPVLNYETIGRLKKWFWRSSFGERYRVGGENFVTNDLQAVCKYIINGDGIASDFGTPPTVAQIQNIVFRKNNSRSVSFILLMASLKPQSISSGARVDTETALSVYNQKNFHHIYPREFLNRTDKNLNQNYLSNIMMLPALDNILISDRSPHEYIPGLVAKLGSEASQIFSTNMMPNPEKFDYSKATYEDFIHARSEIIKNVIDTLC